MKGFLGSWIQNLHWNSEIENCGWKYETNRILRKFWFLEIFWVVEYKNFKIQNGRYNMAERNDKIRRIFVELTRQIILRYL